MGYDTSQIFLKAECLNAKMYHVNKYGIKMQASHP